MVVGAALLTSVAAAAVVSAFADQFARWRSDPSPGARVRVTDAGGWLALPGVAALLAVDAEAAAAAIGLGAAHVGSDAPLEVHVARTSRCPVACTTCYADSGPHGAPADVDALAADLAALGARGVFEVAVGGGDGPPDDALFAIVAAARAAGVVPNLTTAGFGLDRDAARRLREAGVGQVNVSVDGLGETYARVRGWSGAPLAWRAIDALVAEGLPVGVNTVLTRENLDGLDPLGQALAARGVAEWQWLRLKPAGRAAATYAERALTPEQAHSLWGRALSIEAATGLVLRWDCAMVPFLAVHGVPVEALEALAVEGCPGGRSLVARDAGGQWSPCSFASGTPVDAWRPREVAPPEPCGSCAYRAVCRGGCRVVAAHLVGDPLAPDPECPRVQAA